MPADARPLARSSTAWTVVAATGLVLALAGSLAPLGGTPGGGAGGVALSLPPALTMMVLAGFALAALLLLALLVPRGIRRKKKGDEEFELYHEPPRVSSWAVLAIEVLVLLPFVVLGYLVWLRWHAPMDVSLVRPPGAGLRPDARPPAPPVGAVAALPMFDVLFAVSISLAALAAAGVMLWLSFGDRLAWWWTRSPFDSARPLRKAVEESLDDLRDDPDPRRAIIGCYRRFERALAALHVPRSPWQTAVEYMREALTLTRVPPAAVERLTTLFEIARFSQHPVGVDEREAARRALAEIRTSLEEERSDAQTA